MRSQVTISAKSATNPLAPTIASLISLNQSIDNVKKIFVEVTIDKLTQLKDLKWPDPRFFPVVF